MAFVEEVESDDERRALRAMRGSLARHMEMADSNVVAQVASRLQAVITRLAELGPDPAEEVSASDDIARRREARRAAAKVAEAPAGGGVKRRARGG